MENKKESKKILDKEVVVQKPLESMSIKETSEDNWYNIGKIKKNNNLTELEIAELKVKDTYLDKKIEQVKSDLENEILTSTTHTTGEKVEDLGVQKNEGGVDDLQLATKDYVVGKIADAVLGEEEISKEYVDNGDKNLQNQVNTKVNGLTGVNEDDGSIEHITNLDTDKFMVGTNTSGEKVITPIPSTSGSVYADKTLLKDIVSYDFVSSTTIDLNESIYNFEYIEIIVEGTTYWLSDSAVVNYSGISKSISYLQWKFFDELFNQTGIYTPSLYIQFNAHLMVYMRNGNGTSIMLDDLLKDIYAGADVYPNRVRINGINRIGSETYESKPLNYPKPNKEDNPIYKLAKLIKGL